MEHEFKLLDTLSYDLIRAETSEVDTYTPVVKNEMSYQHEFSRKKENNN